MEKRKWSVVLDTCVFLQEEFSMKQLIELTDSVKEIIIPMSVINELNKIASGKRKLPDIILKAEQSVNLIEFMVEKNLNFYIKGKGGASNKILKNQQFKKITGKYSNLSIADKAILARAFLIELRGISPVVLVTRDRELREAANSLGLRIKETIDGLNKKTGDKGEYKHV